jgi:predicted aldo/keto reductase-like oxidoreductase
MEELSQKIANLIVEALNNGADINDIFITLEEHYIMLMSMECEKCRKNRARDLKRNIPAMLQLANETADYSPEEHHHLH